MTKFFASFANDESGATAIEYGLIAGALAVVLIAALPSLTTAITNMFAGIGTALSDNTPE